MTALTRYAVVGIACFAIGYVIGKQNAPPRVTETIYKCDTINTTRVDTCNILVPQYKYIRVIDTLRIAVDDGKSVNLPITQKHYAKDSVYDAWVSGYEPHLDSISIYERTKTQIITNTTTRLIESDKWSYYSSIGFSNNGNENFATMGLTINSPKKWSWGVNVGIGNDGHLYYGINVGLKLK